MAKRNLVISELFRREGIGVTDEEIDARIDQMVGEETEESADATRALRSMMKSGSGRAVLESQILQEKSIQRLLAIVRGDELPELPAPSTETEAVAEATTAASSAEGSETPEASTEDDSTAGESTVSEASTDEAESGNSQQE